ncbi:MAG: TSUP family transporter, partial [Actinomycetota bacterium]
MLLLTAALGALIGLSLGALGGGGSILTVPALVYGLGQTPAAATTGSLVIVGVTSTAGAVAAARAGRVRLGRGLAFGL